MTAWQVLAPIWFHELEVLGPKCRTEECLEPARVLVWWPGPAPIRCCTRCAEQWQRIARAGFGMEIATKPIEYATGRDDAAQRASLLELV